jgi:hypothetical protein
MIEELYTRKVLSTKMVVSYVYLFLEVPSEEVYVSLCVLLKKIGFRLESHAKEADRYMRGMLKIGKEVDWFKEFKGLDSAFVRLNELSKSPGVSPRVQVELKVNCLN